LQSDEKIICFSLLTLTGAMTLALTSGGDNAGESLCDDFIVATLSF